MIHKSSFLSQLFYNKTCVYCLLNASYRHFVVGEYPQRMVNLMVEAGKTTLKLFESEVEREGGSVQMVVGDYLGNFSGDVISRTSFGSSFAEGKYACWCSWLQVYILKKLSCVFFCILK
jgi:hypothetical protein